MSKILQSPVKKWPGTVTIPDYLNVEQAMAFEEAIENIKDNKNENINLAITSKLVPGICACVESWNLEGLQNVSQSNYPATPKLASAELTSWLVSEITKLYQEAEEIPNA